MLGGFRVFETDISFTSDRIPVLRHDWGSDLGQADEIAEFLNDNKIPVLTVPTYYDSGICDSMHAHGIKVFVHTINDLEDRNRLVTKGFDGIYTDRIYPSLER